MSFAKHLDELESSIPDQKEFVGQWILELLKQQIKIHHSKSFGFYAHPSHKICYACGGSMEGVVQVLNQLDPRLKAKVSWDKGSYMDTDGGTEAIWVNYN
jgi:hypothetical protein